MNKLKKLTWWLSSIAFFLFTPIYANTVTGTLPVTATIQGLCLTVTPTPLAFGNYIPGTELDVQTTVLVTCVLSTTYSLSLGPGVNGTVVNRLMKNATSSSTLQYNLYQDSAHTIVWGDTSGGQIMTGLTGEGLAQTYQIYGKIPATQANPPSIGSYSDSVVITATY